MSAISGRRHGWLARVSMIWHATSSGPVAQRSEQGTHNPSVAGSIPAGPTREVKVRDLELLTCL